MSVIVAGFVAAAAENKIRHANTHSQEFPKSNSNRASNKRIIYLLLQVWEGEGSEVRSVRQISFSFLERTFFVLRLCFSNLTFRDRGIPFRKD